MLLIDLGCKVQPGTQRVLWKFFNYVSVMNFGRLLTKTSCWQNS